MTHDYISHTTYITYDMPVYHIPHMSLVIYHYIIWHICTAAHIHWHMYHTGSHILAHIPYWQRDQIDKKLSIKFYRYEVRRIHTDYAIR